MKLKKLFAVVLSCALCVGVLSACGSTDAPSVDETPDSSASGETAPEAAGADVAALADSILAVNPISNQLKLDDNTINLDIALPADSFTAYAGALSNDQDDAGRVIVIAAAAGQEAVVEDALEAYRQAQVAFFGNYPEFADAQAKLENEYALVSGNGVVILSVASNECPDADAMISAVEELVK